MSRSTIMQFGVIALCVVSSISRCEGQTALAKPGDASMHLALRDQPLVAFRAIVAAGSQFDPPGKEGLAALTAALVSGGGTTELTYEQILERLYPMAASFDSTCLREFAVFEGVVHRDNAEAYRALVAEMLARPKFDPADFERVKNELLDYLTKTLRGNDDEELGKAVLQLSIYGKDHPYGHVEQGTVRGLQSITIDDVRAFHARHYTANSIALGTAGESDTHLEWLRTRLGGGLKVVDVAAPALPEPNAPKGVQVIIIEKPADATAISIGFPIAITRRDAGFTPLYLANSDLGEHRTFNGKLMQKLRRDRGLNYGDYSYVEEFIQEGGSSLPIPNNARRQQFFSIWVRPVPHDKAAFALRAALFVLQRLVREGIAEDDFEATRDYLSNFSNLWQQTLDRQLGAEMEAKLYGMPRTFAKTLQADLIESSKAEVDASVREHLRPSGVFVVIVTQDAPALKALLESGKPTPITYDTQGTPDAVLAEDKQIEQFPLEGLNIRIVPASQLFNTPGLPEPEPDPTHIASADAEYYTDSPAQMRPADGTIANGTAVAVLKRAGSYARVRFRPKPQADPIEAWVSVDILAPK